jgi:carbon-monoxide dehydrogenase medium subunit
VLLPDFTYHRTDSLSEALQLLESYKHDAKILAGGTDLLLHMKRGNVWGAPCPRHLVSLRTAKALKVLTQEDSHIKIGAATTHREAEFSPLVEDKLTALHDALRQLASVQIRNVATIAGNVCNAAPCADTAAPLMALGAVVQIAGLRGERAVDLKDLFLGPGNVDVGPTEILKEFWIPVPPDGAASAYLRVARRETMDITIAGVAVYLCCTPDKKKIKAVRIALNTVAPKPIRAYEAEQILIGAVLTEAVFDEAGQVAAAHATPRTSFRSTAEYRREMVKVLVRRALVQARGRIKT